MHQIPFCPSSKTHQARSSRAFLRRRVTVAGDEQTRLVDTLPAVLPLSRSPGRHHLTATTTGYAVLTPHPVTYDRC